MAKTLANYQATLSWDASKFDKGMAQSSAKFNAFTSLIGGAGNLLKTGLVTAAGAAVAAIGTLGTYSVKVGSEFETAMSQVAATMGITVEEIENGSESYEKLSAAAKEMGSTTKYSASECAEALNYLALAGYDADKAVEVLPSVLNLAQAGALDLAEASDMVTDAMSALNIEATNQNVTHFGDELAKTASKSNTSVQQLGQAILTVGGTASYLAGGTTELNTALGILANNGIKGAEGGTKLRNVILSLSAPTDTAKDALEGLGLSVKDLQDADGNLLPLNEAMKKLNDSMDGLSQTEKADVLNKIFNKTDLAAVNALLKDSGESWDNLYNEIQNCDGACQDMADTMNHNLQGAFAGLKSACEGFGIAIYEKIKEPLTNVVEAATDVVRRLTDAFDKGGVEGLTEAAGKMIGEFIAKFVEGAPQMIQTAISLIAAFGSGLASSFPEIKASVIMLFQELGNAITSVDWMAVGRTIFDAIVNGLSSMYTKLGEWGQNAAQAIHESVNGGVDWFELGHTIVTTIGNGFIQFVSTVGTAIFNAFTSINWGQLGADIITLIGNGITGAITGFGEIMHNLIENAKAKLEEIDWFAVGQNVVNAIINGVIAMITALANAFTSIGQASDEAYAGCDWAGLGIRVIEALIQGLLGMLSAIGSALIQLGQAALQAFLNLEWVQTGIQTLTKIRDGIVGAVSTLVQGAIQVGTNAVNAFRNIDWAGLGRTVLSFITNGITGAVGTILSGIRSVGTNALNTFRNIDWRGLGRNVLTFIVNGITGAVGSLLSGMRSIGSSAMSAFRGISWGSLGSNIISGICSGISNAAGSLFSSLRSLASRALSAAKSALGIHSPSRVFRDEVGEMVVAGFAEGIDTNAEDVADATAAMAENAIESAKEGLEEYNDVVSGIGSNRSVKLTTSLDNTGLSGSVKTNIDMTSGTLLSGLGSLFTNFIDKNTQAIDKLISSITSGADRVGGSNSIVINMGDISVSGVLDKDASEQVRDIADEQVQEFSDALYDVVSGVI